MDSNFRVNSSSPISQSSLTGRKPCLPAGRNFKIFGFRSKNILRFLDSILFFTIFARWNS